jgi:hypothetical protein
MRGRIRGFAYTNRSRAVSASLSLSLVFTFRETLHKLEHLNANAPFTLDVDHLKERRLQPPNREYTNVTATVLAQILAQFEIRGERPLLDNFGHARLTLALTHKIIAVEQGQIGSNCYRMLASRTTDFESLIRRAVLISDVTTS